MSNTRQGYRIQPVATSNGIRYQIVNQRGTVVDTVPNQSQADSKIAWLIRGSR